MPPESMRPCRTGPRSQIPLTLLLLSATLLSALPLSAGADDPRPSSRTEAADIQTYITRLDDLEAALKVTKFEPAELEKISPDFKTTYSVRNLNLRFKQPDKLRIDGHSATRGSALMILNGTVRYYSIPKFHLKKSEDLVNSPGKRQSLLEYIGLIVPETLRFMQARFVRTETLNGEPTAVFDLTYLGGSVGSHYRVWIDTRTHITSRREWLDGANRVRATFAYLDPHEVSGGIWLPGRLEVRNSQGNLGAEVSFTDPKANQKLADSLFEIAP